MLSTYPRKCTVTGIDNLVLPGLDLVQCAALVDTSHGIVNLMMHEYAYYGRGLSIHSSGQIEWYPALDVLLPSSHVDGKRDGHGG